jgi:hypothetical protein
MRRLVILYEDSRGPFQRFPLHDLVVKSAAELVLLDVHELFRRVVAVPKNGGPQGAGRRGEERPLFRR